ncbi:Tyrosine-protein kinase Drl [Armadillidium vulgare]|nr:Tyrosine-protein kinase Drl [Armadillidium vulgare]
MVNISLTGNIPTKPSTFKLSLPCTGLLNAEVDVILNINVTSPRPEVSPTVLYFRRRKICMKGPSHSLFGFVFCFWNHSGGHRSPWGSNIPKEEIAVEKKYQISWNGSVSVISTKERGHTTSSSFLESSAPNNLYTIPSSITVNSYASLNKTPIAYFTPTLSAYSCHHSPVNTYTYARPMGSKDSISSSSVDDSSSILNMETDSLEEKPLKESTASRKGTFQKSEVLMNPSTIDFREKFKILQCLFENEKTF